MWPFWMRVIGIVVLLGAIPSIWPYGYYTLTRIFISIISGALAYSAHKKRNQFWKTTFILITILYNPIVPIYLNKEIWIVINLLTVIIFGISLKLFKSKDVVKSYE
jgi:hypothetical protein